ncbi:MAG: redox-regulated ATPase YchF [Nitrososphaerales archaeon]|nr:redox-regulated ATPase YchF [Nitrososphaerales archaeon]
MPIKIGLIGKTNTGKTTFFNSATLQSAEVSTYPFTTKAPNIGIGNTVTLCVHREFKVDDNPKNSACVNGWRFIPTELIDLPGLIKGAWAGKGLGNQFLSVAAQSDALLHIVDASGGVDAEGRITEPGEGDPLADLGDIEEELVMWYLKLIESNRLRISRLMKSGTELPTALVEVLRGMGVKDFHVKMTLSETNLKAENFENWPEDEMKRFAWVLRDISKPTLIVANKMDLPTASENFKRIRDEYSDMIVVPSSAEAELTLRRAEQKGLIKYVPGEERFQILDQRALTDRQKWALSYIRKAVLGEYMRTGVQFAINIAVFKLLRMNTVYPVYDPQKLSDKHGNVLPDVYLMPSGSNVLDLAKEVHSELAKGLIYAIDVRSNLRLPADYTIKDRDVLSIVSTSRKKS